MISLERSRGLSLITVGRMLQEAGCREVEYCYDHSRVALSCWLGTWQRCWAGDTADVTESFEQGLYEWSAQVMREAKEQLVKAAR